MFYCNLIYLLPNLLHRKAQEYERLIKLKATAASGYQINVSSQMVISLDLAAKTENITIDKVNSF